MRADEPSALADTFQITANALQTATTNFVTASEEGKMKLVDFIKVANENVQKINQGTNKVRNICSVITTHMERMDNELKQAMEKIVRNILPAYKKVVDGIIAYLNGGRS